MLQEFGISNNIPRKFGSIETCNQLDALAAPHQHHAYRLCEDAKHCPSPGQVQSLEASEQKSLCFEGFTPLNLDPTTWTQIP